MKKTPLNQVHKELGAKMVPFGGWEMPVQYSGIIAEHLATREKAGLFDVSHMGEIVVEGEGACDFLETVTCNLVFSLSDFQVQYNAIVNEKGGLVDDVTIYKLPTEKYFICSNASNYESVYNHLLHYNKNSKLTIRNESENWHQLALQGPLANEIFSDYLGRVLDSIGYYRFGLVSFQGEDIIVSRTGYTGEDGFEIYTSIGTGIKIWSDLLNQYKAKGLVPVGLGARDTLRLEAKYPLYGHELEEDRTPHASGIGWIVKEKSSPYLGYDRIIKDKKNGASQRTTGIELLEPGVLRENYPVLSLEGNEIGKTTSGSHSPSLKKSIGMVLLDEKYFEDGLEVMVEIRGSQKKAKIVKGSFIKGSVRKNSAK